MLTKKRLVRLAARVLLCVAAASLTSMVGVFGHHVDGEIGCAVGFTFGFLTLGLPLYLIATE